MKYSQLEINIKNIFGAVGKQWLANLPIIIQSVQDYWQISELQLMPNMSYNYVAIVKQNGGFTAVLKIGCEAEAINTEYRALCDFAGNFSLLHLILLMKEN